jgi:hypothetical protein
MVVDVLWPAAIGVKLGAPAIVFFGLGFIIPIITIACQLGASLRIPVTGALLLWAVLLGMFFEHHGIGRRGMGATIRGLSALAPRTLALMHGPSYSGDGAAALRALADDYDRRVRQRTLAQSRAFIGDSANQK